MMGLLWVILFSALTGLHLIQGLPVRPTPPVYPHDANDVAAFNGWSSQGLYVLPALALVLTAVGLLFGCTWCYSKDCKPNEGADSQLFAANAGHLHDVRRPQPDSGFAEPANNNISEDNNNGPISLREMQNIANNNAAAYIVSENEERNRMSRESVVEFEPLPMGLRVADPLERCADWFGGEDLPRNRLQYLREIGRGWFGRVVEGELEGNGSASVAVKILNQNASLEDKARFLDEAKLYRESRHENVLAFVAKCLQEDPWILLFELCQMDLQQYLIVNRPKMAILNEGGVPLQLMCDVTSALAYLHARGYLYGSLWSGGVMVREGGEGSRAVLGHYCAQEPQHDCHAPEVRRNPGTRTTKSEVWSLGTLIWEVCAWGATPPAPPPPLPDLPCPYRTHLYQVMQLCWNPSPESRPTAVQVHALLEHLHSTHAHSESQDDGYGSSDFEERWQRLKPNSIPKVDEHVAIVHAPSHCAPHRRADDAPAPPAPAPAPPSHDALSVDLDATVSRSSSIMSDKDPLSVQMKSDSLTNLHGSLEDVRNIYLEHNETAAIECHQGNMSLDDVREKELDRSDGSMDPWLKDIITGSQDDVSYYKDVSDVIKNLDNILNSEKTSSSESSHQASPSRDTLILECQKDYPVQKSMVKSPGISNFQDVLESIFLSDSALRKIVSADYEDDCDTSGTLSHSFERYSDSISQHTLENLTPETPDTSVKYISGFRIDFGHDDEDVSLSDDDSDLPKDNIVYDSFSDVPTLKELCEASMPIVIEASEFVQQLNAIKDCRTPCDNKLTDIRIDINDVGIKSVDDIPTFVECDKSNTDSETLPMTSELESKLEMNSEMGNVESDEQVLPRKEQESATVSDKDNIMYLVTNDICKEPKVGSLDNLMHETEYNVADSVKVSDEFIEEKPALSVADNEKCENSNTEQVHETSNFHITHVDAIEKPEAVQNLVDNTNSSEYTVVTEIEDQVEGLTENENVSAEHIITPETVQNSTEEFIVHDDAKLGDIVNETSDIITLRSEVNDRIVDVIKELSNDSTVYMDLINDTNNQDIEKNILNVSYIEPNQEENDTCDVDMLTKTESTVYLDLPSVIKETDNFLHSERVFSNQIAETAVVCASTPKGSDSSVDTLETSTLPNEYDLFTNTKVADCDAGVTLTKCEQKCLPDISPPDSPTKSHHTDTYDENSSVVLGPFESCSLELFKTVKSEIVDLPKEELLAFSSNFSEMNLETPSPLRDGNFLNEVPDIVQYIQFDDVLTATEKPDSDVQTDNTENTYEKSNTEKRVSPSTPPNSPGIFLASSSQQKYLVDIDLTTPDVPVPQVSNDKPQSDMVADKEIDLNQIELQMTSNTAANNENILNIEYTSPVNEGFANEDDVLMLRNDEMPESYLAGNGRPLDDLRGDLTLDEECVKALRNELELKLPLAQVAAIEPAAESEWGTELPPPPELVLSYPGALSPIAEETGQQLSAYENDVHWNTSTRTESSESYPEPCNNSADEVTDIPTGQQSATHDQSTYTVQSRENSVNHTYTVHKEIGSSKEITMSADSLNASPLKKLIHQTLSPIDDRTYNKNEKEDERLSNCERLSQVSPFLLSPTTDTSAPDHSDNVAGCSTLSKPTVPTDAKSSKPSETQCLSKATSIDSWCSNDTLYNVEENFDDLALEPDVLMDYEPDHEAVRDDKSESTDTLTHNEEKEPSLCSTYIIHDSKSEVCETFSPDSITGNDNNTYTKPKTEAPGATTSVLTKSELNDSEKNTQTKDLAYGTLMSGLPSYSNCTTDLLSTENEAWRMPQPELVRRSPLGDDFNFTPPKPPADKECADPTSPITAEPVINRMDSVEVTCLKDNSDIENKSELESQGLLIEINDSEEFHYRNLTHSVTSTPLLGFQEADENVEVVPFNLPQITTESGDLMNTLPNFQSFIQSAEIRPQDLSLSTKEEANSTEILEGESKSLSRNSNKDSLAANDRTPTYSDFEHSAASKPQDLHSRETAESLKDNTQSFQNFESSARNRPQDLSSLIDASSLLLKSERRSSELAMDSPSYPEQTNRPGNPNNDTQSLVLSPPNIGYINESHIIDINKPIDIFITDLDMEEETEQPHSIIITESPMLMNRVSPSSNRALDAYADGVTYDSGIFQILNKEQNTSAEEKHEEADTSKLNGVVDNEMIAEHKESPDASANKIEINDTNILSPRDQTILDSHPPKEVKRVLREIKCNGDSEKYATVSFLNESFEELLESNVDDNDIKDSDADSVCKEAKSNDSIPEDKKPETCEERDPENIYENLRHVEAVTNGLSEADDEKMTSVTENFLHNEKKYCELDSYFRLLSDISFTGPGAEIMTTSFNQETPTEPISPECEPNSKPDAATDILKEWDSDSDSHSTNSSSGEFIWKGGDGRVESVVPSTRFEHQREGGSQGQQESGEVGSVGNASSGSEGSGSEGDEVEFVPSSWDCRAAPAKSSLRSLEQAATPDSKKRVVFKRQKYHCVYEYPREAPDADPDSPAYLPDYSTYSEWDPTSAEDAELGYGQLFGGPSPLDMFPLRAGIAFSADYDEDFFISSSARPFESLGVMSTTSQFFPGMHVKPSLLERDIDDLDDFPPPPSPLPPTTLIQTKTPSLDFTTPDSGVEDITPGSTSTEDDFKTKKIDTDPCWKPVDSASSSESVSPSSPGGEALGGLRHTRDKLKLDLPPSPHLPSPRHNRVFNFVLDKPKRRSQEERAEIGSTPLVMTDETPIITTTLPLQKETDDVIPEPTFSTFGKCSAKNSEPEQKAIILTDDVQEAEKQESPSEKVEPVKGEGTVLDSGDEDSGIESSSKATLERKSTPNIQ